MDLVPYKRPEQILQSSAPSPYPNNTLSAVKYVRLSRGCPGRLAADL